MGEDILLHQGAEAKIFRSTYDDKPAIIKERFVKTYRHAELDSAITKERMKAESRALARCKKIGIHSPDVYLVDMQRRRLVLEDLSPAITVREQIQQLHDSADQLQLLADRLGQLLARLHEHDLIHGDLTTSNLMVLDGRISLIDFGLSFVSASAENKAVDLYVLERAILSTHPGMEEFTARLLQAYTAADMSHAPHVIKRLDEVRMRGRKRSMLG